MLDIIIQISGASVRYILRYKEYRYEGINFTHLQKHFFIWLDDNVDSKREKNRLISYYNEAVRKIKDEMNEEDI